MKTFADALRFFADNLSLFGTKTVEHLELSGAAVAVAIAIAIPLGVWLGHIHRGSFVAINISNVGRALPSLAVIAVGLLALVAELSFAWLQRAVTPKGLRVGGRSAPAIGPAAN